MDAYKYSPLPSPTHTRVLELLPARQTDAPLQGNLIEADLSSPSISYEALSYVWGSRTDLEILLVDCKRISITPNCAAALRQFRYRSKTRRLWVDAICMNQNDTPERNQQVKMMDKIYRRAAHVRVWLGEPKVGSKFGLKVLQTNVSCTKWAIAPFWSIFDSRFGLPFVKIVSCVALLPALMVTELSTQSEHIRAMTQTDWLERMWTIQEIALARQATVHYGPVSCSWKAYSAAVTDVYTHLAFTLDSDGLKDERFRTLCALRDYLREQMALRESVGSGQADLKEHSSDDVIDYVVSVLSYTQATDPKDKAYGVYGVLQVLDVDLPAPDYAKSTSEIYLDTMMAIHKAKRSLNLKHFWRPDSVLDLPSWLPDWTSSTQWQFPRALEPREKNLTNRSQDFCASLNSTTVSSISRANRTLSVKGIMIDGVSLVGKTYVDDKVTVPHEVLIDETAINAFQSWREVADITTTKASSITSDTTAMERLAEVMFRDTPLRKGLNDSPLYTFDALSLRQWFDGDMKGPITKLFRFHFRWALDMDLEVHELKAILPSWNGQKVFGTQNSRLGMAGSEAREGDVVALVAGCNLPLILRPIEEGVYQYICPTYFPGAMLGEMWPSPSDGIADITMI